MEWSQALISLLREAVSVVKQKEAQIAMKKASASRVEYVDGSL